MNPTSRGIQPGGITILVIFTVLCLAIFSVLSLGTVRADARLSQKHADLTQHYYAADVSAQAWIEQTDTSLRVLAQKNTDDEQFWAAVQQSFGAAFDPALQQMWHETPISETQTLAVCLQLTQSNTPIRSVVSYKVISTTEIPFDESLPLWEGEEEMTLGGAPNLADYSSRGLNSSQKGARYQWK